MQVNDFISSTANLEPELELFLEVGSTPKPLSTIERLEDCVILVTGGTALRLKEIHSALSSVPLTAKIRLKDETDVAPLFGFRRVENQLYCK